MEARIESESGYIPSDIYLLLHLDILKKEGDDMHLAEGITAEDIHNFLNWLAGDRAPPLAPFARRTLCKLRTLLRKSVLSTNTSPAERTGQNKYIEEINILLRTDGVGDEDDPTDCMKAKSTFDPDRLFGARRETVETGSKNESGSAVCTTIVNCGKTDNTALIALLTIILREIRKLRKSAPSVSSSTGIQEKAERVLNHLETLGSSGSANNSVPSNIHSQLRNIASLLRGANRTISKNSTEGANIVQTVVDMLQRRFDTLDATLSNIMKQLEHLEQLRQNVQGIKTNIVKAANIEGIRAEISGLHNEIRGLRVPPAVGGPGATATAAAEQLHEEPAAAVPAAAATVPAAAATATATATAAAEQPHEEPAAIIAPAAAVAAVEAAEAAEAAEAEQRRREEEVAAAAATAEEQRRREEEVAAAAAAEAQRRREEEVAATAAAATAEAQRRREEEVAATAAAATAEEQRRREEEVAAAEEQRRREEEVAAAEEQQRREEEVAAAEEQQRREEEKVATAAAEAELRRREANSRSPYIPQPPRGWQLPRANAPLRVIQNSTLKSVVGNYVEQINSTAKNNPLCETPKCIIDRLAKVYMNKNKSKSKSKSPITDLSDIHNDIQHLRAAFEEYGHKTEGGFVYTTPSGKTAQLMIDSDGRPQLGITGTNDPHSIRDYDSMSSTEKQEYTMGIIAGILDASFIKRGGTRKQRKVVHRTRKYRKNTPKTTIRHRSLHKSGRKYD